MDGPYSYEVMAEDTIQFLEQVVGGPARLVGVSDGAVVSLLVAKMRPDLVNRLICVAGVFHYTGWVASAIDPDNEVPELLIDSYAEVSPDGKEHFSTVKTKIDQMHESWGSCPVQAAGHLTGGVASHVGPGTP